MAKKLKLDELNRISSEEFKEKEKSKVVLLLDSVRSLHNVGSVFRTADSFLVEKIYLCGITGTPPNREINKTALGATDSVDWEYVEDALEQVKFLKNQGWKIIALEQVENSISLQDFIPIQNEKYAFIFGNEVFGVNQSLIDLADSCIEIPQFGTKHSMNISVTVGIVLWDMFSKMNKAANN